MSVSDQVNHLFRQESGKMVAVLTRIFGINQLELVQDVVQDTMIKALQEWEKSLPDNHVAWMYRVARNRAIDLIRRNNKSTEFSADLAPLLKSEYSLSYTVNQLFHSDEIQDSQLRMIFTICHPELNEASQIAFTLKYLGGLSVRQIASAFLVNEETIQKRIYRARQKFAQKDIPLEVPGGFTLLQRLDNALKVIYLMFNEGYHSSHPDQLIIRDICLEAMRLTKILSEYPPTANNKTFSLLALMCFHVARFEARVQDGEMILLPDQDRSLWNQELISKGNDFLDRALVQPVISSYFMEASIMAVHCNTASYAATNWHLIYQLYQKLHDLKPSPLVKLHQLVALSELKGPQCALQELEHLEGLEDYYLYHAIKGSLLVKSGCVSLARQSWHQAYELAKTESERQLIRKKLQVLAGEI